MRSTQSIKEAKASSLRTRRVPFSADQRLLVLQKLQGRTDLAALLSAFVSELHKHIDINELTWSHEGTTHTVSIRQRAGTNQTFSIRFGDTSLGTLRYQTAYPLDQEEISVIHTFHRMLAGPLNTIAEITRLQRMAYYDSLTGLKNRFSFNIQLEKSIASNYITEDGLILVVFDMDNFKGVNDRYGHLEGDKVLKRYARQLELAVNGVADCFRLGGDEFATLINGRDPKPASVIYHRLKTLIANDRMLGEHHINCSAGYAIYQKGDTPLSLFERADQSMYRSKKTKR
ncbi:GGDEF domain-containing protein [Veronia pacifica]|uniref:diguanylate cyclase n=1 Tax=Veronia pacifica TaxID=1080227 RepID=A0A1C3EI92_9GAMM|nr:GGDEF domain-containing protein [Veronia pacifica]ODA32956.1 hypothetical protein A8L45_12545 [Veronia pacifica]